MDLEKIFSNKYGRPNKLFFPLIIIGDSPNKMVKDYLSLVKKHINKDSVILDAGCGKGGIFARSKLNKKLLIGIDMVKEKNSYIDKKVIGDLKKLPFKDNSFDIIVCEWVAEHIEYPYKVMKEFYRVLKKNSTLILLTQNIWNPLIFLGNIIPNNMKDAILKKLLKEEDLFPLFMRLNSTWIIDKISKRVGFKREFLKTYPNPGYFRFNKILLAFIIYIDKVLIKFKFLNPIHMNILASYRK